MEILNSIDGIHVKINSGFWYEKQQMNEKITIPAVYKRFKETGRFDAFACNWKEGEPNPPHIFWDSDVAKWIEGIAYVIERNQNEKLISIAEAVIDNIEKNQLPNGYFNSYFNTIEKDKKFQDRGNHELYCAGHLIEAAIAYKRATGKDRFLKLMCKYADYIEKVFKTDDSANYCTPGHEEIELALIKLYRATCEKRYLELSQFFIDKRGNNEKDEITKYNQSHLPVREQFTAVGHAVRAVYLYCAMADIARETCDAQMLDTCKTLFSDIVSKRMYITGGIGASATDEAFSYEYDLPNLNAYSETCAAIGLALFCHRMIQIDHNAKYADVIERILYNGFLSSVSLDGKRFFYENPLEIDPAMHQRADHYPAMQRKEVFDCSCCPPNIVRFFPQINNFIYSNSENTLFVNQFINNRLTYNNTEIIQKTDFPQKGSVHFYGKTDFMYLAVRIPDWCTNFETNMPYQEKDGYAVFQIYNLIDITVDFHIKPVIYESSPKVQVNAGRIAVMRGPVVYCLESVDNGDYLRNVSIDLNGIFEEQYSNVFGGVLLKTQGYIKNAGNYKNLYQPVSDNWTQKELTFIPYYGFANRGEAEMIVWINQRS